MRSSMYGVGVPELPPAVASGGWKAVVDPQATSAPCPLTKKPTEAPWASERTDQSELLQSDENGTATVRLLTCATMTMDLQCRCTGPRCRGTSHSSRARHCITHLLEYDSVTCVTLHCNPLCHRFQHGAVTALKRWKSGCLHMHAMEVPRHELAVAHFYQHCRRRPIYICMAPSGTARATG